MPAARTPQRAQIPWRIFAASVWLTITAALLVGVVDIADLDAYKRLLPFQGLKKTGALILAFTYSLLWFFVFRHKGKGARLFAGLFGANMLLLFIFVPMITSDIAGAEVNPFHAMFYSCVIGAHWLFAFSKQPGSARVERDKAKPSAPDESRTTPAQALSRSTRGFVPLRGRLDTAQSLRILRPTIAHPHRLAGCGLAHVECHGRHRTLEATDMPDYRRAWQPGGTGDQWGQTSLKEIKGSEALISGSRIGLVDCE